MPTEPTSPTGACEAHDGAAPTRVVQVATRATHELRRAVLRAGTPSGVVTFDGDDDPSTWHLAAVDPDGRLVGVSTWLRRNHPHLPTAAMVQIRGMAVETGRRGTGVGSLLLQHGIDRARDAGAATVWARARDTALGFYLRHHFEVIGDGYVDDTTELPHHDVARRL